MSSTDTINCPMCHENIPLDYVVCPYDGYSLIKQLREKAHTKIKFREGIGRAIRLIRNPRLNTNYVMDEVITNPDRKGPLLVLFILSWTFGFQIAPFFNAFYGDSLDIVIIFLLGFLGGFIVAIFTFLFYVIFWYIITFIIHFSSKLLASSRLTGTAAFKETQSIVGYALAPYIVGMFILNILLFILIPANPNSSTFFNFETNQTLGITYANGLGPELSSSIGIIYLLFFLGFSIWSVYICATGLEKLHRITKIQSFIIPAAVVFLYLFITYSA